MKEEIIKGYNTEKLELNKNLREVEFELGTARCFGYPENGRQETIDRIKSRLIEIDKILKDIC